MPTRFRMDASWKRLEQVLGPSKSGAIVKKHMRKANLFNGKIAEEQIRDTIKKGKYEPNAPLTVAIKKSEMPLVGVEAGATLRNNITSQEIKSMFVFIGVLRTNKIHNIAVALHEGTNIKVTNKMRAMFWALWLVSEGRMKKEKLTGRAAELFERMPGGWKPLNPGTKVIIIPARPFIKQAFLDSGFRMRVKSNWERGLKDAFAEMKASVGSRK